MVRSACSTLALLNPFGPFFFGGCRYAHLIDAFLQGVHGSSPSHLTLRFRQQSQARFKIDLDIPLGLCVCSRDRAGGCCCVSIAMLLMHRGAAGLFRSFGGVPSYSAVECSFRQMPALQRNVLGVTADKSAVCGDIG